MSKIIYYVRHGENIANLIGQFSYKKVDYSLTEKGVKQAEATGRVLEGKGTCALYCSPLKRAIETAETIGRRLNLTPVRIEELREVNVGSLEDRPPSEKDWSLYSQIMMDWRDGKHESRFPDGEDYTEMTRRAKEAFLKVIRSSGSCRNIVVVAHAGILLGSLPAIFENWRDFDSSMVENCSISTLELDDDGSGGVRGRILSWRDCAHLIHLQ